MKKNIFTSIMAQLLLLVFVIVWIIPTFGLFISSFRDKDLLAISGWWTSLITTQVNEIHRTENQDSQIIERQLLTAKMKLGNEEIFPMPTPLAPIWRPKEILENAPKLGEANSLYMEKP